MTDQHISDLKRGDLFRRLNWPAYLHQCRIIGAQLPKKSFSLVSRTVDDFQSVVASLKQRALQCVKPNHSLSIGASEDSSMDNQAFTETVKKLISVREFASRYGIGLTNTYAILKRGDLSAVKIGKLTRIRSEDADRRASNLPLRHIGEV